ncbi:uncharacterized protein [Amphiura filiformis]|uniref:uncharacterized protein n=1 Tax=Amphiura filiformis TaxID=82378 RepID=UPI003B20E2AC
MAAICIVGYSGSSPGSGSPHVVVFGDSLTKYLAEDIAILDQVRADVFCKPGATVLTLCDAICYDWDILKELKPDAVVIHVGTNTLERQLVSRTIRQLRDLAKLRWILEIAADITDEVMRVCNGTPTYTYSPSMIPPLNRMKTGKQKARERRQYLRESAERCKYTRPCLQFTKKPVPTEGLHQTTPTTSSCTAFIGEIKPVVNPVYAGLYAHRITEPKAKMKLPSVRTQYVEHKNSMKRSRRRTEKARRKRRRKKKRKMKVPSSRTTTRTSPIMPVAATCTPTTEESTTQPSATQPSPSPTTTHPSPSPATTQPSPSPATTQPSPSPTTSPVASGTEAHELPSRTLTRDIANIVIVFHFFLSCYINNLQG